MTDQNTQLVIVPFYSPPDELALPISTYVIAGGQRVVIIDPGPAWHLAPHIETIKKLAAGGKPIAAVIQSPEVGGLSGLPLLSGLSRRRSVIIHWKATLGGDETLDGWKVQALTTKTAGLPVAPSAKLALGMSPSDGPPGSLLSFERSTGTLFSGPFLGSLGAGQHAGTPRLKREAVKAYRDVFVPSMSPDLVSRSFGADIAVNQIAPTHGRMAVGGTSLIRTIFQHEPDGPEMPLALSRLFLRTAALVGEETASGIYRATGVPVPDIERGYSTLRDGAVAGISKAHWTGVLTALEQWLPGSALSAVLPVVVYIAQRHGFPLTPLAERFSRSQPRIVSATAVPTAESARSDRAERAIGTADMPGTMASEWSASDGAAPTGENLTDPVTGLMNETVFKQRLAGQAQEEAGTEGSGALILVGVDNIQRINNTYGRTGGDEALYTVAYLLRNFQAAHSRRGAHRLYKLTGPHFAYVLSRGSTAEGADVAERIRRAVSESAMFLEQLSVSVGVVGLDEITASGATDDPQVLADEVTSRAFSRLKVARQGGANTVCSSDPAGAANIRTGATVLIADPDAPYLEMLTRQLEDRGYTVLLAADGQEALGIIGQIAPDAIVAEVMLPKTNGFALREELRHDAALSRVPFILVSHRKTDETIEKASMLGIVHFLAKPFSLVELVGLLRNLTGEGGHESARGGDH